MDVQTSLPAEDTLLINTAGVIQENVLLTCNLSFLTILALWKQNNLNFVSLVIAATL